MSSISTIGIYLPKLDKERMLRFVDDDTRHWANVAVPDLQAQGFLKHMSEEDVLFRANELAEEMLQELESAALIEIEVQDPSHTFDPSSIEQAWEPTYLAADGKQLLEETGSSSATATIYRVAFWVHSWNDSLVLASSLGDLQPVPPTVVPERLWRLAPSVLVD